jgi:allantoinase
MMNPSLVSSAEHYPRDLIGYGKQPIDPKWPGGARIAVEFVLNYEAGGERNTLHGDAGSEGTLTDLNMPAVENARNLLVESSFEYGSRCGVWRVLRLFEQRGLHMSVFAVGMALERNPEVARALAEAGHEILSHGWRWIDYRDMPEQIEREHIRLAIATQLRLTGERPLGGFIARTSMNSRRLLVEEGFLYDQDAINDELPYWVSVAGRPHLVIPTSFDANDSRFVTGTLGTSGDFFEYVKDAFDMLYAEGADQPKLMTVALHERWIGRPGRAVGLARFLDYILAHDRVWVCRGIDIARHWAEHHALPGR